MNTTLQLSLSTEDLQLLIKNAFREAQSEFPLATSKEEKFLTRIEAAQALSITLPTLHAFSLAGKLKAYRLGRNVRYKQSELHSALEAFNL